MAMSGKWKITIDTAVLANGDSIAAYLTSAAGTLLTHTTLAGKERLDVMSPSEFAEDSAHTTGDYGTFALAVRNDTPGSLVDTDGDYAPLQVDSTGRLRVLADLTAAFDFVYPEDSAHVNADPAAAILAVRKDALSTNVSTDGDYANLLQWAEGSLKVVDIANISVLQQQVSVADGVATLLPTVALATRRSLLVQNVGNNSIWIGSATVTAAGATGGVEVPKGGHIELEAGPNCVVYGIASGAAVNARILEMN